MSMGGGFESSTFSEGNYNRMIDNVICNRAGLEILSVNELWRIRLTMTRCYGM